jgi:hypothetical protein
VNNAQPANLQTVLNEQLERSRGKRSPEVNAALAQTAKILRADGAIERALGVGSTAPEFTLPNAVGNDVSLGALLDQGPVVVAFYRGGW